MIPPDVPLLGPLDTPTPVPTATPVPTDAPTSTPEATPVVRAPEGNNFFIWPVEGPISSYFGPSHPLGIDIDLFDNPNAQIVASRGGKVSFAGGSVMGMSVIGLALTGISGILFATIHAFGRDA